MPEYHIVRHDAMTQAVNTYAAIETLPDGSTGGAVRVPQGVRAIVEIRATVANSAALGTDSGVVLFLRLTGNGLVDGQQDMVLQGLTVNLETTGAGGFQATQNDPYVVKCNILVKPGNDVSLAASQMGVDCGTPEVGIELVFA